MLLGFGMFAFAQPYNVTFQVDMNTQSPIADTVTVAGNFQAAVVGQTWTDWTPGITILDDANMDGVYELTVQLPAGTYEYKYVNGTAWGADEGVPAACAVNGNR
jgi:alpha-amylase